MFAHRIRLLASACRVLKCRVAVCENLRLRKAFGSWWCRPLRFRCSHRRTACGTSCLRFARRLKKLSKRSVVPANFPMRHLPTCFMFTRSSNVTSRRLTRWRVVLLMRILRPRLNVWHVLIFLLFLKVGKLSKVVIMVKLLLLILNLWTMIWTQSALMTLLCSELFIARRTNW